jgi:oxygen-independent coproporphyrinogen-3 oxidase
MKLIEDIYNKFLQKENLNTSYPLIPSDWAEYRVSQKLPFAENEELSFYIHIPFCQNLCNFCEYTRMKCPSEDVQQHYLNTLDSDIQQFVKDHPHIVLRGFDIGGGTPTVLSRDNFARLIDIYLKTVSSVKIAPDCEPSIEGTFQTLTENKLQLISNAGIKRLSLGIQTTNSKVLFTNQRSEESAEIIEKWIKYAKSVGIRKINLDLMYGLKGQTSKTIESDIATLASLTVEQITLYELRTNMLNDVNCMTKEDLFKSYNNLYNGLTSLDYQARFGQNTFSVNKEDFGVSSYLRNRMLNGISYKGFGLSAQSMSKYGISYNVGKNKRYLSQYLNLATYNEEYTYRLPAEELLSKYIAISAYSGQFSLKTASEILEKDCNHYFMREIDFCVENELMTLENDTLFITRKGFKNYGAVFFLFCKLNKNEEK